jgi:hypothetical protein
MVIMAARVAATARSEKPKILVERFIYIYNPPVFE